MLYRSLTTHLTALAIKLAFFIKLNYSPVNLDVRHLTPVESGKIKARRYLSQNRLVWCSY